MAILGQLGADVMQGGLQGGNGGNLQASPNTALIAQPTNQTPQQPSGPGMSLNQTNGSGINLSGPASQVKAQSITPNTGQVLGASTVTGGTSGTGGAARPGLAALMQAYQNQGKMYQNDYNNLDAFQNANTGNQNNIYNAQAKTYNDQFNQGNQNLDLQTKVLNDSYQRSLQQLGNNIRTQFNGFQNQLGIGGAGDSSANQMGAYALAHEQNMNRGFMNTDLNNQLAQIGNQRGSLGQNYNDEIGQLQAAHQQALSQVAEQYGQLKQQILHNIQGTNVSQQAAMAYLGQWAGQQLQNLDQNVMSQAASVNAKYGALANQPQNLSFQPNFQATAITAPTVPAQVQTSQQVSPNAALLAPGFNASNQNQVPLAVNPMLDATQKTNPAF